MRKMKRLLSILVAATMTLAMAAPRFAQEVDSGKSGGATITIENASKGEEYKVYKLFDATVTGTEGGSIAYIGTVPEGLTDYFTADGNGYITPTEAARADDSMSEGLEAALTEWVEGADPVVTVEADGSTLDFTSLEYGYYVVTTSQGNQAITVTSTNPSASIYDKNNTTPTGPDDGAKHVNETNVSIGDTVTYTITFNTTNYDGSGEDAKKVTEYMIHDTLPDFLKEVTVTSVLIDEEEYQVEGAVPQFEDHEIVIPWVDDQNKSYYDNGAKVVITYTAVVTEKMAIDGAGNTNTVTITWKTEGDEEGSDKIEDSETIFTYALAIKKIDDKGDPLAGATFSIAGITAEKEGDGVYVVSKKGDDVTAPTVMECDSDGILILKGVAAGEYIVTEEKAPNGYNKLADTVSVTAIQTGGTTTNITRYLDAQGNVVDETTDTEVTYTNNDLSVEAIFVVNHTGSILPSTGGIGTTIFYAAGIILMAGAVFFVVRRRKA